MTRISRVLALAVALSAAPSVSSAQVKKFLDPGEFSRAAFGMVRWNDLNGLPDGATVVPFGGSYGNAVLTGASVTGGGIETSTPFNIVFTGAPSLIGFGATLSPLAGPVNVTFTFWSGPGGSVSQLFAGPGNFFLGGIALAGGTIDQLEVSVDAPARFEAFVVAAPEPATMTLVATGLFAVVVVGRRRRRR